MTVKMEKLARDLTEAITDVREQIEALVPLRAQQAQALEGTRQAVRRLEQMEAGLLAALDNLSPIEADREYEEGSVGPESAGSPSSGQGPQAAVLRSSTLSRPLRETLF